MVTNGSFSQKLNRLDVESHTSAINSFRHGEALPDEKWIVEQKEVP